MLFDHNCRYITNFIKELSLKNFSCARFKSLAINSRVFHNNYILSAAFEVSDSSFRVINKNSQMLIYSLSR
jgi:hypothetical protein